MVQEVRFTLPTLGQRHHLSPDSRARSIAADQDVVAFDLFTFVVSHELNGLVFKVDTLQSGFENDVY